MSGVSHVRHSREVRGYRERFMLGLANLFICIDICVLEASTLRICQTANFLQVFLCSSTFLFIILAIWSRFQLSYFPKRITRTQLGEGSSQHRLLGGRLDARSPACVCYLFLLLGPHSFRPALRKPIPSGRRMDVSKVLYGNRSNTQFHSVQQGMPVYCGCRRGLGSAHGKVLSPTQYDSLQFALHNCTVCMCKP